MPESRLPFVQISSIHPKTAAKAWNWYERRHSRNGTRICFWNIPIVETGLPFQTFRCSREFSTETTWQVVFHLLPNRIFGKLFVHGGKQPVGVCVCFSRWLVIRVRLKWPANRKFVRTNGGHLGRTVDRPLFWALNIGWKLCVVSQAVMIKLINWFVVYFHLG